MYVVVHDSDITAVGPFTNMRAAQAWVDANPWARNPKIMGVLDPGR